MSCAFTLWMIIYALVCRYQVHRRYICYYWSKYNIKISPSPVFNFCPQIISPKLKTTCTALTFRYIIFVYISEQACHVVFVGCMHLTHSFLPPSLEKWRMWNDHKMCDKCLKWTPNKGNGQCCSLILSFKWRAWEMLRPRQNVWNVTGKSHTVIARCCAHCALQALWTWHLYLYLSSKLRFLISVTIRLELFTVSTK